MFFAIANDAMMRPCRSRSFHNTSCVSTERSERQDAALLGHGQDFACHKYRHRYGCSP